jgi:hypothetical protein
MATTYPTTKETRNTVPDVPPFATGAGLEELRDWGPWVTDAIVALQERLGATASGRHRRTVNSEAFNLDNGAGVTVDRVVLRFPFAITLVAGRIVYEDATTGTVAAGSITIGTTVAGAELVAATNYENAKAVGTVTALAFAATAVAANTPIIVRHTGVAITQAGFAHVELDYTVDA